MEFMKRKADQDKIGRAMISLRGSKQMVSNLEAITSIENMLAGTIDASLENFVVDLPPIALPIGTTRYYVDSENLGAEDCADLGCARRVCVKFADGAERLEVARAGGVDG